jgi:hypothetical protein
VGRLSRGQAALIARQQAGAAPDGPVTYTRKAAPDAPIDLTGRAWVGRTVFSRIPNAAGATVVFGDRDYLVAVADLPAEPERGDRIAETINGQAVTFEVMAPASEPAWRYSDPARTVYRIHAKEVT